MTNSLDVLAIAEQVSRDSLSGDLSHELLAHGHTLYGKQFEFPDYIERLTPDGRRSLGYWRNGEFEELSACYNNKAPPLKRRALDRIQSPHIQTSLVDHHE